MSAPLPDLSEEVALIAASVVDGVVSVTRVPSFAGNRVFHVTHQSGAEFFKFGSAADIAREHTAIGVASAAGVPVPHVTAFDQRGTLSPHPLLVLEQVPGGPCDGTEPWFRSGTSGLMTRLHSVTLERFGTTTGTDAGQLRGDSDSWIEALHERAASAHAPADAGLVPPHLINRVLHAVERHSAILDLEHGHFLHGDFHPRHVYSSGDTITAVIDWGDATSGDHDYDLARLLHAAILREQNHSPITAASELLQAEGVANDERLSKLLLYAAVFLCSSMAGEFAGGSPWPPWWPVQTHVLSKLVTSLDQLR